MADTTSNTATRVSMHLSDPGAPISVLSELIRQAGINLKEIRVEDFVQRLTQLLLDLDADEEDIGILDISLLSSEPERISIYFFGGQHDWRYITILTTLAEIQDHPGLQQQAPTPAPS